MDTYKKLVREAESLVRKLQNDITTGKRKICENYGQKEIQKFMDTKLNALQYGPRTYQEVANIQKILNKVSDIC